MKPKLCEVRKSVNIIIYPDESSEYYCKENVLKIWREFYSGIYKHFVNKG